MCIYIYTHIHTYIHTYVRTQGTDFLKAMAQEFLRTMGLSGASSSPHSELRPPSSELRPTPSDRDSKSSPRTVGVIYSDMPMQTSEGLDGTTGVTYKEVKTNGQGAHRVSQGTNLSVRDNHTRSGRNYA
jgi:hypothetical protein